MSTQWTDLADSELCVRLERRLARMYSEAEWIAPQLARSLVRQRDDGRAAERITAVLELP